MNTLYGVISLGAAGALIGAGIGFAIGILLHRRKKAAAEPGGCQTSDCAKCAKGCAGQAVHTDDPQGQHSKQ